MHQIFILKKGLIFQYLFLFYILLQFWQKYWSLSLIFNSKMSLSILALGDCYFAKINISAFCNFFMPIIYYLNKFLTHAHYGIGRRKS